MSSLNLNTEGLFQQRDTGTRGLEIFNPIIKDFLSSLNSNWDIINHWETAVLVKAPTLSEEKSHVDGFMT